MDKVSREKVLEMVNEKRCLTRTITLGDMTCAGREWIIEGCEGG
jgi:hypothetical protein